MQIISFVAQGQNSGKTYLIEKLIPALKRRGLKVAALKHGQHINPVENKDTASFSKHGADRVIGFSDGGILQLQQNSPVNLEQLLNLAGFEMDIVLVEGFKQGPFPKIEVFNDDLYERPLCLDKPGNFLAVVSRLPIADCPVPRYSFEDIETLCDLLQT